MAAHRAGLLRVLGLDKAGAHQRRIRHPIEAHEFPVVRAAVSEVRAHRFRPGRLRRAVSR